MAMEDEWEDDFEDDEEDEGGPDAVNPANKMLRVQTEMCDTCVFRPGNKMGLRPGRLRDLVEQTAAGDTNVVCHKTLDGVGALCRGSIDQHPGQRFRIFERLNGIEWVQDR